MVTVLFVPQLLFPMPKPKPSLLILLCSPLLLWGATSCRKAEITSSVVVKDLPEKESSTAAPEQEATLPPAEELGFQRPDGWEAMPPDQLNVAKFIMPAASTPSETDAVSVNVTPLASFVGNEGSLVDMWRNSLGQAPLGKDAASKLQPIEIGAEAAAGQQFEVEGPRDGGTLKILTAFLHRNERTWFFKLQGPAADVEAQKPNFYQFLKTVQFKAAAK